MRRKLAHCSGVHTVCGEGVQGTFVESVQCVCLCVCVDKYQVCGVQKMALHKNFMDFNDLISFQ